MLQRQVWFLIWTATALSAAEGPHCPLSIAPERCREEGAPLDEFFFVINGQSIFKYSRIVIFYCKHVLGNGMTHTVYIF